VASTIEATQEAQVMVSYRLNDFMAEAYINAVHKTMNFRLTNAFGWMYIIVSIIVCINQPSIFMIGTGAAVLSGLFFQYVRLYTIYPRKCKNQSFSRIYTISIDDNGIHLNAEESQFYLSWKHIEKVWRTGDFYYLFFDKTQYWFIPTECFKDSHEHRMFLHITQKYHKIQVGINR
jgi:hypothetical protein